MTKPFKSQHTYIVDPQAVAVSEQDKRLAPVVAKVGPGGAAQVRLGQTSCHYVTQKKFIELVSKWLRGNTIHHIVTLNPEMVMEAETNDFFSSAINAADLRVPDGTGLVWARWYLRSDFWSLWPSLLAFPFIKVERIPGVDALMTIAKECTTQGKSVYLLGGTAEQNKHAAEHLATAIPGLTIHRAINHAFDLAGPERILADIRAKSPAALFAAYGAPKQALWIQKHKNDLPSVRLAMGIGGALAILSEEKPRAPKWLQKLNAEWLWRLLLEPSRFNRIYTATIKFPLLIHRQKTRSS